jgi:hypothetical protein
VFSNPFFMFLYENGLRPPELPLPPKSGLKGSKFTDDMKYAWMDYLQQERPQVWQLFEKYIAEPGGSSRNLTEPVKEELKRKLESITEDIEEEEESFPSEKLAKQEEDFRSESFPSGKLAEQEELRSEDSKEKKSSRKVFSTSSPGSGAFG